MASTKPSNRRRFWSGSQARQENWTYALKVILLGDTGVGKTSFLHSYLTPNPSQSTSSSPPPSCTLCPSRGAARQVGVANGRKMTRFDEKTVCVTVWDTAGQERFRSLTPSYYRGAHACIVMYDVYNVESFNNVTMWLESVLDYTGAIPGIQTVLVGTSRSTHHPHHLNHPHHSHDTATSSRTRVDRARAENLASHYQIPHFEVDLDNSDSGIVTMVMDAVVSLVMTRALENHHLSRTLQPQEMKRHQLTRQSRRSKCSECCNV